MISYYNGKYVSVCNQSYVTTDVIIPPFLRYILDAY